MWIKFWILRCNLRWVAASGAFADGAETEKKSLYIRSFYNKTGWKAYKMSFSPLFYIYSLADSMSITGSFPPVLIWIFQHGSLPTFIHDTQLAINLAPVPGSSSPIFWLFRKLPDTGLSKALYRLVTRFSADLVGDSWNLTILSYWLYIIIFRTAAINYKIGGSVSQLSFQHFVELVYFDAHFSIIQLRTVRLTFRLSHNRSFSNSLQKLSCLYPEPTSASSLLDGWYSVDTLFLWRKLQFLFDSG